MRVRRGVVLKQKPSEAMRLVHGVVTNCEGLARISLQARLNEMGRRRQEETTMAVVLDQPHRRGALVANDHGAIGRFCANYRPVPLADWLRDAGEEYGRIIYEFRKSIGAPTVNQSTDPIAVRPVDANGQPVTESARADLAQRRWSDARDVLDGVDRQAATKLEYVCHDDRDPPPDWAVVLKRGLIALSDHLKLTPKNFREGA